MSKSKPIPTATLRKSGPRKNGCSLRRGAAGPTTIPSRLRYDPKTGADMTDQAFAFAIAMDRYKRDKRRPFPTWSEVIDVLLELGWTPPP